jgi:hypothetical protein
MNGTLKYCNEEDRQRLRKAVGELTAECPLGPKNPAMCPLHSVRKRRPSTRIKWVESLNDEELGFLVDYHGVCLKWQEAGRP